MSRGDVQGYSIWLIQIWIYRRYRWYKCKIDIFVSGDLEEEKIAEIIYKNPNIQRLNERTPEYNQKNAEFNKHQEREIIEKADVTQGNLILGLSIRRK